MLHACSYGGHSMLSFLWRSSAVSPLRKLSDFFGLETSKLVQHVRDIPRNWCPLWCVNTVPTRIFNAWFVSFVLLCLLPTYLSIHPGKCMCRVDLTSSPPPISSNLVHILKSSWLNRDMLSILLTLWI